MAVSADYRSETGRFALDGIASRKDQIALKIENEHPRAKHHYNVIRRRGGECFASFLIAYGEKCAYCGVSIPLILSLIHI